MERVLLREYYHSANIAADEAGKEQQGFQTSPNSPWLYIVHKGTVFSRAITRSDFSSRFIRLKFLPQVLRGETIVANISTACTVEVDKLKCFLTVNIDITVEKRNRRIFEHFSISLARDESVSPTLDDYEILQELRAEKNNLDQQVSETRKLVRKGLSNIVAYYKEQNKRRQDVARETRQLHVDNFRLRCRKRKFEDFTESLASWDKLVHERGQ